MEVEPSTGGVPVDCLHGDEINDSAKPIGVGGWAGADRNLEGQRCGGETFANLSQHAIVPCADTVQLVNKANPRHPVLVGLPPHSLALRFHSLDSTEDHDGSVEDSQAAFDFSREVDVTWGINDVDGGTLPAARDSSGVNGDTALSLFGVEVSLRSAFVDVSHPMRGASVV